MDLLKNVFKVIALLKCIYLHMKCMFTWRRSSCSQFCFVVSRGQHCYYSAAAAERWGPSPPTQAGVIWHLASPSCSLFVDSGHVNNCGTLLTCLFVPRGQIQRAHFMNNPQQSDVLFSFGSGSDSGPSFLLSAAGTICDPVKCQKCTSVKMTEMIDCLVLVFT